MSDHLPPDHDEALAVETYVVQDSGQWKVEIVVVFGDEAVRKTVNTYRTRRQAEIAASWMKRGADRTISTGRSRPVREPGDHDE